MTRLHAWPYFVLETETASRRNWELLVAKSASWAHAATLLATSGPDAVELLLRSEYGLPPGAALEVVRLLRDANRQGAFVHGYHCVVIECMVSLS